MVIELEQSLTTCKPGKTALLIADSRSTPRTGSFLKKIMPPLGPLKDCSEKFVSLCIHKSLTRGRTATLKNIAATIRSKLRETGIDVSSIQLLVA